MAAPSANANLKIGGAGGLPETLTIFLCMFPSRSIRVGLRHEAKRVTRVIEVVITTTGGYP